MPSPNSYPPSTVLTRHADNQDPFWMSMLYRPAINACILGISVLAVCLFGILSRTGGDLATFWVPNAFLLGILVRYPHFAHPLGWVAAAAGFFVADAITGASLTKNLLLNVGNLAGVGMGYWIFHSADRAMSRLQTPSSVLYMLIAIVGASAMSSLFGTVAMIYLFNDGALKGFAIWFATEMVNYIVFLPLLLTIPSRSLFPQNWGRWFSQQFTLEKIAPALALLASALLGHLVGGPGAVAFTIPALMWCAVSYSLFTTSFITFWVSTWSLISIIVNMLTDAHGMINRDLVMSARLGLSLVMLTPIMIGSMMTANRELVKRLKVLADQDQLTNLSNRRAFLESSTSSLGQLKLGTAPSAALMLDLDHFKSVNDRYGHAAGDAVLRQLGGILTDCLRRQDYVGRMGGEEFAVFLPRVYEAEAREIAERVRERLAQTPLVIDDHGQTLQCTMSIGLVTDRHSTASMETLLVRADQCLYIAKQQGRNRVVQVSISD